MHSPQEALSLEDVARDYGKLASAVSSRMISEEETARDLAAELNKLQKYFLDTQPLFLYIQIMFTSITVMVRATMKAAWRASAVAEGGSL